VNRRGIALVAALVGTLAVCLAGWALASPCSGAGRCAAVAAPMLAVTAVLTLVGGSLAAWAARTVWLLLAAHRDIWRLPVGPAPVHLLGSANRAGIGSVRYLPTGTPIAFCAGALRPAVFVSAGLVGALAPDELEAVLLHEGEHRRRHDPFRRAARRAAAEVCFCIPLVRWWAERQLDRSEAHADAAVLRDLGAGPLARALCRVDTVLSTHAAAAFGGAAEIRVAQLLGDPLPRRTPDAWTWAASGAGLAFLASVILCASALLGHA